MKQTIFIAILIFAFCFAAFAQANESQSKPTKITEYEQDYSSENGKFAVHDLSTALQKNSKAEGIIKIQADGNNKIIQQLQKIKFLLKFMKADFSRFSFAISSSDKQLIQYWLVPLGEDIPDCEKCVIIRAEDYDKLVAFFYLKPKQKKRRK